MNTARPDRLKRTLMRIQDLLIEVQQKEIEINAWRRVLSFSAEQCIDGIEHAKKHGWRPQLGRIDEVNSIVLKIHRLINEQQRRLMEIESLAAMFERARNSSIE
jgi:hypothetical protein